MGRRKVVDEHKRKRVVTYAKTGKRALPKPVFRMFPGFGRAFLAYLSGSPGAVRTAHQGMGVCKRSRKLANPAAPPVITWAVKVKRESLGTFPEVDSAMKMWDLGSRVVGDAAVHFEDPSRDLLLPMMYNMTLAELKKHGDEAKISMKEAAAKNLADEALAAANAAHVTAQALVIASKDNLILNCKNRIRREGRILKAQEVELREQKEVVLEISQGNFSNFLAFGGPSRDDADEERISQLGVLPSDGQGSDKASGSDKQQGSDEASGSGKQQGSDGERAAYQEPSSDDELGQEEWKFGEAWQLTDEARGGDKQLV